MVESVSGLSIPWIVIEVDPTDIGFQCFILYLKNEKILDQNLGFKNFLAEGLRRILCITKKPFKY